jgi:hypothetical protein
MLSSWYAPKPALAYQALESWKNRQTRAQLSIQVSTCAGIMTESPEVYLLSSWNNQTYAEIWQAWDTCIHMHAFKVSKLVSLLLLGKLGTRQYFQKVSGTVIAQSTEGWHKNKSCIHERNNMQVSVRLSCTPSYLLLGKLGTRQYFQKVSAREIVQPTELQRDTKMSLFK